MPHSIHEHCYQVDGLAATGHDILLLPRNFSEVDFSEDVMVETSKLSCGCVVVSQK